MKYIFYLILIFSVVCCSERKDKFVKKKIPLKKGDFWVDSFNNLGLSRSNLVFKDNKLYGNTLSFEFDAQEYFYCLDLITGKVVWANKISDWASFQPLILNDIIYYVTFTGNRYAFDTLGNELWFRNSQNTPNEFGSYSGHTFNPINNNLYLTNVFGGIHEFNKKNGDFINNTEPTDCILIKTSFPVFIDNYMYYVTECKNPEPIVKSIIPHNSLVCQDYFTKAIKWTRPIRTEMIITHLETIHTNGRNIFLQSLDSLFSFDGESGKLNWKIPLAESGRFSFRNDRILGGNLIGIDYNSGNKIQYLERKNIYKYLIRDSLNNMYTVDITNGSIFTNNKYEDSYEVEVKKVEKR